jgi:hypothetical protein
MRKGAWLSRGELTFFSRIRTARGSADRDIRYWRIEESEEWMQTERVIPKKGRGTSLAERQAAMRDRAEKLRLALQRKVAARKSEANGLRKSWPWKHSPNVLPFF